jgi:hypothetical protein
VSAIAEREKVIPLGSIQARKRRQIRLPELQRFQKREEIGRRLSPFS